MRDPLFPIVGITSRLFRDWQKAYKSYDLIPTVRKHQFKHKRVVAVNE